MKCPLCDVDVADLRYQVKIAALRLICEYMDEFVENMKVDPAMARDTMKRRLTEAMTHEQA